MLYLICYEFSPFGGHPEYDFVLVADGEDTTKAVYQDLADKWLDGDPKEAEDTYQIERVYAPFETLPGAVVYVEDYMLEKIEGEDAPVEDEGGHYSYH